MARLSVLPTARITLAAPATGAAAPLGAASTAPTAPTAPPAPKVPALKRAPTGSCSPKELEHAGVRYPSRASLVEALGVVAYNVFAARVARGWDVLQAASTPAAQTPAPSDGPSPGYVSLAEEVHAYGLSLGTYRKRRARGLSKEAALSLPVDSRAQASGRMAGAQSAKRAGEGGRPRRTPVVIDGVCYPSINRAARMLGVGYSTLYGRVHREAPKGKKPA